MLTRLVTEASALFVPTNSFKLIALHKLASEGAGSSPRVPKRPSALARLHESEREMENSSLDRIYLETNVVIRQRSFSKLPTMRHSKMDSIFPLSLRLFTRGCIVNALQS